MLAIEPENRGPCGLGDGGGCGAYVGVEDAEGLEDGLAEGEDGKPIDWTTLAGGSDSEHETRSSISKRRTRTFTRIPNGRLFGELEDRNPLKREVS